MTAVELEAIEAVRRFNRLYTKQIGALNEGLLNSVNSAGEVFLSHTRVRGKFALRLAVGHLRTTETHVARAWTLIREKAAEVAF